MQWTLRCSGPCLRSMHNQALTRLQTSIRPKQIILRKSQRGFGLPQAIPNPQLQLQSFAPQLPHLPEINVIELLQQPVIVLSISIGLYILVPRVSKVIGRYVIVPAIVIAALYAVVTHPGSSYSSVASLFSFSQSHPIITSVVILAVFGLALGAYLLPLALGTAVVGVLWFTPQITSILPEPPAIVSQIWGKDFNFLQQQPSKSSVGIGQKVLSTLDNTKDQIVNKLQDGKSELSKLPQVGGQDKDKLDQLVKQYVQNENFQKAKSVVGNSAKVAGDVAGKVGQAAGKVGDELKKSIPEVQRVAGRVGDEIQSKIPEVKRANEIVIGGFQEATACMKLETKQLRAECVRQQNMKQAGDN